MKTRIVSILYRHPTESDMRYVNQTGGPGGGRQSYIDIGVNDVTEANMNAMLGPATGMRKNGPEWTVNINSFNVPSSNQTVTLYQRRDATYAISSQKIASRKANRVKAWHPDNGFINQYDEKLVIYFVKTQSGEIWAGWFLNNDGLESRYANTTLENLTKNDKNSGYIELYNKYCFATGSMTDPFIFGSIDDDVSVLPEEVELIQQSEDISVTLNADLSTATPEVKERIQKYRTRSKKLCDDLKKLYNGTCQITGRQFSFQKKDGSFYTEVHHLIPLGKSGSDSYFNAIVVCPMIHRMLHYADVGPIDLSQIVDNKLPITINGTNYTIEWKPEHAQKVHESLDAR